MSILILQGDLVDCYPPILQNDSGPASDFLVKILGVDHRFFGKRNFTFHLLHYSFILS
jgi:hypothetical protein